jgi:hypothetical protein
MTERECSRVSEAVARRVRDERMSIRSAWRTPAGWRIVSAMFDRERLIASTR